MQVSSDFEINKRIGTERIFFASVSRNLGQNLTIDILI